MNRAHIKDGKVNGSPTVWKSTWQFGRMSVAQTPRRECKVLKERIVPAVRDLFRKSLPQPYAMYPASVKKAVWGDEVTHWKAAVGKV